MGLRAWTPSNRVTKARSSKPKARSPKLEAQSSKLKAQSRRERGNHLSGSDKRAQRRAKPGLGWAGERVGFPRDEWAGSWQLGIRSREW